MRFSRLAATGIGLAAAAAVALTGIAPAAAALLVPGSYPRVASLIGGQLTITLTNATSKTATCWLSVHDASTVSQLTPRVSAVNAILVSGIESSALNTARSDAATGALHILANAVPIAKDASTVKTWASGRSDTSYAIYQECTTPDPITGLTVNGLAQVYTVTGTGAAPQFSEPALTISGTGTAGTELEVVSSGWGATPTSYSWEWRRASDDSVVASGSGPTIEPYLVTAADAALASPLYAMVTAHRAGYPDATWASSFSATAHLASFSDVTAVPTVSGTGRLGSSFAAAYDATGVSPAPTSVSFRWHTPDGTLVGTGSSFAPTRALLGQPLYATAVLSRVNHQDYVTLGSAFTATVSLADQAPGAAPVIAGRNVVGGSLTASVDTSGWAPVPDSFDYQWYLEDGTPIPGADEATLPMTADLVGEVVYVVATAHALDHFDYVIASAPSGRIAEPVLGASLQKVEAGGAVTVQAWGLLIGETYTVELHSDPVVLGTAVSDAAGTIHASFTIPASVAAGSHTLVLLRGGVAVATLPLTVTAPPPAPAAAIEARPSLAASGADSGAGALAIALLLAGAAALIASRAATRRRRVAD